jgi:flagellar biosynthesis/type III secretory pathway ATPase
VKGSNADIDHAIHYIDAVNAFLTQGIGDHFDFSTALEEMKQIFEHS